ncbi:hypothetical protein HD600_002911 [Microbacterium ginsengiterrae]|uniref:Uncharacterized protein n=1 Tax=Microbacterium ginsengiterrae TaxID=546115 RepID=A0A7W9CEY8_9MICO|nr:hypothetical protein [Microbacterium ginsengiterrae]MBB5744414.1 hypothetical protein [Microbacterium ginsengiterrae]
MSTSDQQGDRPLTRKQLREIRLTGATPVIGEHEAAAAKQAAQTPAAPAEDSASSVDPAPSTPAASAPASSGPTEYTPTEAAGEGSVTPLTRRQARARERMRAASVPATPTEDAADEKAQKDSARTDEVEAPSSESVETTDIVDGLPVFAPVPAQAETDVIEDAQTAFEADVDSESDEVSSVFGVTTHEAQQDLDEDEDADAEEELSDADAIVTGERPIVSPDLGTQLLDGQTDVPDFAPSFDELITSDSGGTHRAPNTLIFTHPGEGSLSGPVASTGELLITGSYELPKGLGSQGHAHGTADGKDIDAVLIDGELPLTSSPTPIAASSAVSTIKPAGEVIRPPAPEKGNKLMLTLAITAGGLALALAVALIVAFTTNVFG